MPPRKTRKTRKTRKARKTRKTRKTSRKTREKPAKTTRRRRTKTTKKRRRVYYTHDNGGRPFRVDIVKDTLKVYKADVDEQYYSKTPAYTTTVTRVWVGRHVYGKTERMALGNAILAHIKGRKYVFVGDRVVEFQLPITFNHVTEFYSNLGNSDVAYPVAFTKTHVIGLLHNEMCGVAMTAFNPSVFADKSDRIDGYSHLYDWLKNNSRERPTRLQNIRVRVKRLW